MYVYIYVYIYVLYWNSNIIAHIEHFNAEYLGNLHITHTHTYSFIYIYIYIKLIFYSNMLQQEKRVELICHHNLSCLIKLFIII